MLNDSKPVSLEKLVASGQHSKEETYWLNHLAGELVKISFPKEDINREVKEPCESEESTISDRTDPFRVCA